MEQKYNVEVTKQYRNVVGGKAFTALVMDYLEQKHRATSKNTAFAHSTCADGNLRDSTAFNDYFRSSERFVLGGLAGIPFRGITGMTAFAHHQVGEDTPETHYLIIAGTHIGINREGKWGHVRRKGQKHDGHACGACVGAYGFLESGGKPKSDELDREQFVVQGILKNSWNEIQGAEQKYVQAARVMNRQINGEITAILERTSDQFHIPGKIFYIHGTYINTPGHDQDLFSIEEATVITNGDLSTKRSFLEELLHHNPFRI